VKKQAFTHLKMPMVHLCHELRLHGIHRVLFVGDAIMRRLFLASILRFIPPDMRSRSGNVLQPTPRWAPSSARILPSECPCGAHETFTCPAYFPDPILMYQPPPHCASFFVRDTSTQLGESRKGMVCSGNVAFEFVYLDGGSAEMPTAIEANRSASLVLIGLSAHGRWARSAPAVSELLRLLGTPRAEVEVQGSEHHAGGFGSPWLFFVDLDSLEGRRVRPPRRGPHMPPKGLTRRLSEKRRVERSKPSTAHVRSRNGHASALGGSVLALGAAGGRPFEPDHSTAALERLRAGSLHNSSRRGDGGAPHGARPAGGAGGSAVLSGVTVDVRADALDTALGRALREARYARPAWVLHARYGLGISLRRNTTLEANRQAAAWMLDSVHASLSEHEASAALSAAEATWRSTEGAVGAAGGRRQGGRRGGGGVGGVGSSCGSEDGSSGSSSSSGSAGAVPGAYFMTLIGPRPADVADVISMIQSLERFGDCGASPLVALHEPWSGYPTGTRERVLDAARGRREVRFGFVNFSHAPPGGLVPKFDPKYVHARKGWGYLHMCRFMFAGLLSHPAFQGARYLLRMDSDSSFELPVPNLFRLLEHMPEVDYVTSGPNCDCGSIVAGLRPMLRTHAAQQGQQQVPAVQLLTSEGDYSPQWNGEEHKMEECFLGYYNNFELLRLGSFRKSAAYQKWIGAVDAAGGIYRSRWGDALLRRAGCALMGCRVLYWDDVAPRSRYCHGAIGRRERLCYGMPPGGASPEASAMRERMEDGRPMPGVVQWEANGILMRHAFG